MEVKIKKIILWILVIFFGFFIVSMLLIHSQYMYGIYGDNPVLSPENPIQLIIASILCVFFMFGIYFLGKKCSRIPKRVLFPFLFFLFFWIQLGFVLLFPRTATDDSQTCLALAHQMLYQNDFSSLQKEGYLYMFPSSFGFVMYLKSLFFLFPDNYLTFKIANIIWSLITSFSIYGIYNRIVNWDENENNVDKSKNYGILLLALCYVPSIMMNNLVYNDVPATALFSIAIFLVLKFHKKSKWYYMVGAAIALALGNFLRNIGFVILIAIIFYMILQWREVGFKKICFELLILSILFPLPSIVSNQILLRSGMIQEPMSQNSAPVSMWLHMGINKQTFGFWDSFDSYDIYQNEVDYNKEKSNELFLASIKEKVQSMTPVEILTLFGKKLIWTWTEGTYQIDRYGMGNESSLLENQNKKHDNKQQTFGSYSYITPATKAASNKSKLRSVILYGVHSSTFVLYCFSIIGMVIAMRKKRFRLLLPVLYVLGFICFYLLWEIKSRYLYPVYPMILVLGWYGFSRIISNNNLIVKLNKKYKNIEVKKDNIHFIKYYFVLGMFLLLQIAVVFGIYPSNIGKKQEIRTIEISKNGFQRMKQNEFFKNWMDMDDGVFPPFIEEQN